MKFNLIRCFFLIAVILQLASCTREKKVKKATTNKEQAKASDTIFDRESPYYKFIQKNYPKAIKDNKLMSFDEKDIDLDGINEGIVALGQFTDDYGFSVFHLFILKNDHGVIKQVIYDFEPYKNVFIGGIKLIQLQDKEQTYITLLGDPDGFVILELVNNKIKEILSSPNSEDGGQYEFIDSDSDGKYDGYIHKQFNCFPIEDHFVFENGAARKTNTKILIPDFPSSIKDVLYQYIALRSIDVPFDKITEVKQRLKQLSIAPITDQPWNKDIWHEAYMLHSFYDSEDEIKFDIEENDNTATALVNCSNSRIEKDYQLKFELQQTNNKWQITKIEVNEE